MKFEGTKIFGLEGALVGMRLPMCLSYDEAVRKSDSSHEHIGESDLKLTQKLINADHTFNSQPNSKFLRMIHVQVCVTAPSYWWPELDTYKVGVTRDSSSFMHKGASRDFTLDDFDIDAEMKDLPIWKTMLVELNDARKKYLETKDMKYFRYLRQLLPASYCYTSMLDMNYAVLRTMISQRKHHRLKEWREDFIDWCHQLPYADELLFDDEETKE